jgi:hypothetical protein
MPCEAAAHFIQVFMSIGLKISSGVIWVPGLIDPDADKPEPMMKMTINRTIIFVQ